MRDPMSWHVIEEPGGDGVEVTPAERSSREGSGLPRSGPDRRDAPRSGWAPGSLGGGPAIVRLALAAAAGAVVAAALVLAAGGSGAPAVAVEAGGSALPLANGTMGPGASPPASGDPGDASKGSTDGSGPDLLVDVEGAVERPGVVRLPPGARIGDAIEAAGGYAPSVDVDRAPVDLNLAAPVSDGDRVRVPAVGDPVGSGADGLVPGATAGPASAADGSAAVDDSGAATGLLDLNRATQAQLEALPGIGPVTARKILDARETAPFAAAEDLRTRKLVGAATYVKIAPLVTVGP
jgi:competence protein ComEA